MPAPWNVASEISWENCEDHSASSASRWLTLLFFMPTNKNYHWQTFGLLFRDLHLMFDEFAQEVLETNDELAEGIRMIGPNIENV
jgi:DNA-binding ferritin-like protein